MPEKGQSLVAQQCAHRQARLSQHTILWYVYHVARIVLLACCRELQALAREASFYQLPVLVEHISNTSIMPQPATQTYYDSLYLETGFKALEGPEIAEMER